MTLMPACSCLFMIGSEPGLISFLWDEPMREIGAAGAATVGPAYSGKLSNKNFAVHSVVLTIMLENFS